mmetsp:Transcript_52234/g.152090  ORF Transcript_52234/g.152090 Transcript_52234/m.152090 type:complete len:160 (-) Transcript_52234:73-552(-)
MAAAAAATASRHLLRAPAALAVELVPGLAAATCLQRRWRRHPKGGRYGPQFHHFPTEVKLNWPPKDRSQLWLLPDSKRIMFVTNGWIYPSGVKGQRDKRMVPVLAFASRKKHNHMDSLTIDEVEAFERLMPQLEAKFKEVQATLGEGMDKDASLRHESR